MHDVLVLLCHGTGLGDKTFLLAATAAVRLACAQCISFENEHTPWNDTTARSSSH